MIDYAQAEKIAIEYIGADCGLVETATLEKPYGWYFCGQSKTYLQTGDVSDMLFGSGGFVVEREEGRIFGFGSLYPLETWFANYEKGFKYDSYDLMIVSVADVKTTVRLLHKLDMNFVVPEIAHGVEWKIPRSYGKIQIQSQLRRLPCIFRNQRFWHRVEVFDDLNASKCCSFELHEHTPEV